MARSASVVGGRAAGVVAGVVGMVGLGGGCLQILGDDVPFVLGSGAGAAGGSGGAGAAGGVGTGGREWGPRGRGAGEWGRGGREDVGICKGGMGRCGADGKGGACAGEVTPQAEDPAVVGDEKCDGYAPGEAIWSKIYGDSGIQ